MASTDSQFSSVSCFFPQARAIESQCYVVAAAQFGQHNEKRMSYGHSLVVDPWGKVIADAGGVDSEGSTPPSIVTCEIDLLQLENVRERMPVQLHRENAEL
jgi:predicted amidohydrolase